MTAQRLDLESKAGRPKRAQSANAAAALEARLATPSTHVRWPMAVCIAIIASLSLLLWTGIIVGGAALWNMIA